MLVLSRRVGEKIIVGDNIVIEVLEIRRDSIRLGFIAPLEIKIYREELYKEISEEHKNNG